MTQFHRRNFLKAGGALAALSGLAASPSHAAAVGGYKALVCVFLFGGMDNYDTLMPTGTAEYDAFRALRPTLFDQYGANSGAARRRRQDLVGLTVRNSGNVGNRTFGLPTELSGLADLFNDRKASIVANVGPLVEPVTAATLDPNSTPGRLFSHNDQQAVWQTLFNEGGTTGWGGRFADEAQASLANTNPDFTTIAVGGSQALLSGETTFVFNASLPGQSEILELQKDASIFGPATDLNETHRLAAELLRSKQDMPKSWYKRDVVRGFRRTIRATSAFDKAFDGASPVPFPALNGNTLADGLELIANIINVRAALGARRQIFFVPLGGFDTHNGQAYDLPSLQQRLSDAVVAFEGAIDGLGLSNDVTLFTASDFGRTLTVNGDGTDHGWGGHHFVVGGAVDGGKIFGTLPDYTLGHDYDAGRGRLIPTTSIQQYAYRLGRWFGLSDAETKAALPGIDAFGTPPSFI